MYVAQAVVGLPIDVDDMAQEENVTDKRSFVQGIADGFFKNVGDNSITAHEIRIESMSHPDLGGYPVITAVLCGDNDKSVASALNKAFYGPDADDDTLEIVRSSMLMEISE